jgi:hypothetical protein
VLVGSGAPLVGTADKLSTGLLVEYPVGVDWVVVRDALKSTIARSYWSQVRRAKSTCASRRGGYGLATCTQSAADTWARYVMIVLNSLYQDE